MASYEQNTDDQKRALLQAIAEQGSAGRQAYANAQTQVQTGRQSAVSGALARAGAVDAPEAYRQRAQAEAVSPYDAASSSLASGQATFEQDIARQNVSNESYFDKVKAAVPILNAENESRRQSQMFLGDQADQERQAALTEALMGRQESARNREYNRTKDEKDATREDELFRRKLQELGITGAESEKERAFRREMEKIDLLQNQTSLANTRAAGARAAATASSGGNYKGKGTPVADLLNGLGGKDAAKIALKTPVNQMVAQLVAAAKANTPKAGKKITNALGTQDMTKLRTAKQNDPSSFTGKALSKTEALNLIEANQGLPAGTLDAILGKDSPIYKAPTGQKMVNDQAASTFRSDKLYLDVFNAAVENIAAGKEAKVRVGDSIRQEIATIRKAPDYKKNWQIYEQVIRDLSAG